MGPIQSLVNCKGFMKIFCVHSCPSDSLSYVMKCWNVIPRCCSWLWRRCCRERELKSRTIIVGHPNSEKFPANVIRNQKYNIITFLPLVSMVVPSDCNCLWHLEIVHFYPYGFQASLVKSWLDCVKIMQVRSIGWFHCYVLLNLCSFSRLVTYDQ